MDKVFISHATEDSALALKLDDWIRNKAFPGHITTFVSASLESLPAGTEWAPKIIEEIRETKIMFCLLGPTTRDRPWIHFEAGAARINGATVVPVLHSGLSPDDISGPLRLRQVLRMAHPDFPQDFFRCISKGGVPAINFKKFAKEVEVAARQVRGPREVMSLWDEALREGKLNLAKELLSESDWTADFIKTEYGSLEELSKKYKESSTHALVHEAVHVDTHAAVVVYYKIYQSKDSFVRQYHDVVLLEDGKWKYAPQYVVRTQLRPSLSSSTHKPGPTSDSTGTREKARAR